MKEVLRFMRTILIVEDSSTVTKILKHILKQHADIKAIFAASFTEGKALYEQHQQEIFAGIIDLSLPDAPDGEMIDYLLSNNLPVIVLTANYQEDKRERLLGKGIVDYIIKEGRYSYNYALNLVQRLVKNQHIKILVAEDSKPARHFIKALLEKHLYQVLEAEHGIEALQMLTQHPDIKLLITDYHMPEMDGFELVRTIRQSVDKSGLVIIGLSGEGKGSLSAKFIKNGANDFLQKPFCHEELYCRVMHNIEELELIDEIRDAANRDYLTKLHNRRYFFERGTVLHSHSVRKNSPLAVAVLDIDHFKQINDNYGHMAGDRVLTILADELEQTFSRFVVARMAEEFAIIMPGLNNEQAYSLLDKFRSITASMPVDIDADDGEYLDITLSVGVTNIRRQSLDDQLKYAYELLYRAKEAGRNMVVCDEE